MDLTKVHNRRKEGRKEGRKEEEEKDGPLIRLAL